jgi:predicted aspartyl protease
MSHAARTSCRLVPLLLLPLLVLVGCSGEKAAQATTGRATTTQAATTTEAATTTQDATTTGEGEARSVRIRVLSGAGGVFAFLRVYIGGKGPFAFTVDTGASHSVVDFDVVRRLGLKTIGEPVEVTGITCRGEAGRLRMARWRAGAIRLPAGEIQTIDMPDPGGGIEIDGLLGSDVLSTFGAITVDYEGERLFLAKPS